MLWFLDLAARAGHVVDSYVDEPEGVLRRNEAGKLAITNVILRPHAVFATHVSSSEVREIHRRAHDLCYLASSVMTDIRIEPQGLHSS